MQPRITAILFVIAAALGAFVYLYEIEGEGERTRAEEASRRLFPEVEASSIGFLLFRTEDDRLVEAIRIGEQWHLQQPVEFPGDDVNLNSMASTLAGLTSEASIESPAAPEVYGLGDSSRRVQFRAGDTSYTLRIGAEAPVGGNVYVSREGESEQVFMVAAFRVKSFERDLESVRDKRVLTFDRARVERVVASWQGGTVTVEKASSGWEITHPEALAGPADQKTIDDLLSDVSFLRAESFVDDSAAVQKAASAEPYYTLRLGLKDQQDGPLEVALRVASDENEDEYLVRGQHAGALYRVPRGRIDGFPRDLFAFRFKQVSNFDAAKVQAFELVYRPESHETSLEPVIVRVERSEGGWASTSDAWLPGKAAALIAEFARLDAVSVEVERATANELASFGLSPPRITLRAFASADALQADPVEGAAQPIAEVFLGALDRDAGFPAVTAGETKIVRLDAALAEQIPESFESLQANFLAPPPAPSEAENDVPAGDRDAVPMPIDPADPSAQE